jgi:hypothetical protein
MSQAAKEASVGEQLWLASQDIAAFVYPEERLVSRLNHDMPEKSAASLWRGAKGHGLLYVTTDAVGGEHLCALLTCCEHALNLTQPTRSGPTAWNLDQFAVRIYADSLKADFLSKLSFLSVSVTLHEWRYRQSGTREVIMIRELTALPVRGKCEEGAPVRESAVEQSMYRLSADEFNEVLRMGVDLKKLRESYAAS